MIRTIIRAQTIVTILFVSACENNTNEGEGIYPDQQSSENEAPGVGETIQVNGELLVIEEIVISDRFPPDCDSSSFSCSVSVDTHSLLIIWLEPDEPDVDPNDYSDALFESIGVATIEDSQGRISDSIGAGLRDSRLMLLFQPERGETQFTMRYPGSDPIEIEVF